MTFMTRRRVAVGLAAATGLPALALPASAQESWPAKPIRMVVPFPPGGGADFLGRLLAQKMSEGLRKPIIVDNKPGGATTIGSDAVAKAAPDGYTILMLLRDMALNPTLMSSLPFDTLKSFAWIGKIAEGPFVLVANPAVPANTVAEIVAMAKAKPGGVSYGSLGLGGFAHVCMEALLLSQKIEMLHVPYRGAGPALQAVVTGEVQLTLAALTGAIPFVREGRLKAIVVGDDKRWPQLPNTPSILEAGGGDTIRPQYYAFAAPAATPRAIIDRLNSELKQVLEMQEVREKLDQAGIGPKYSTPEQFAAQMADDVDYYAKLIKAIGIPQQ